MENFPLFFEQVFKRLLIFTLLLATIIIGIPSLVIYSQPQNFKNAMYTLSHPQKSLNALAHPIRSKKNPTMKTVQNTPTHLLSMGWLVSDNSPLSNYNDLRVVSPLFATIGSNDQIQLNCSTSTIANLHAEGKQVWGRVTLSTQSDAATQHFLENPKGMIPSIHALLANAEHARLDGLNLDIEQISPTDLNAFSQFVQNLSKATKQAHLTLSIDLQPEPNVSTTQLTSFNRELGKDSDYIIFMGYDEHWSTDSTPGPVTSLQWLEDNIKQFTQTGIPPQKLVLGLPSYSNIWQVNQNGSTIRSVSLANEYVNNLMQKEHNQETWEPQQAVYYTSYNKYGNTYKVWLTNNRSLEDYLNLISTYHLAGTAFWSLNMISSTDWNQLIKQFNASHHSNF